MSGPIYNFVRLFLCTLYPSYASFKAVKNKNVKDYVKWMMYWIIFSIFSAVETILDPFVSFWLPFYCEIKVAILLYLVAPATRGSSVIYRWWVHPLLCAKEEDIDNILGRIKEQGYNTAVSWVQSGAKYLAEVMVTTAIKGGGGLVNQLKKSYSLTDLSDTKEEYRESRFTDITDEKGSFSPYATPIQRRKFYNSQSDLTGDGFRSNQLMFQSPTRVLSNESISSGYNTDFYPVQGDTMDTGDYELWDRREQIFNRQENHEKLAMGQRHGNQHWKENTNNKNPVIQKPVHDQKTAKPKLIRKQHSNYSEISLSEDEEDTFYESHQTPLGQPLTRNSFAQNLLSPNSSCYPSDRESLVDSGSETECDDDIFSDATLEDFDETGRLNYCDSPHGNLTPNRKDCREASPLLAHTHSSTPRICSPPIVKQESCEESEERPLIPPRKSAKSIGITNDSGNEVTCPSSGSNIITSTKPYSLLDCHVSTNSLHADQTVPNEIPLYSTIDIKSELKETYETKPQTTSTCSQQISKGYTETFMDGSQLEIVKDVESTLTYEDTISPSEQHAQVTEVNPMSLGNPIITSNEVNLELKKLDTDKSSDSIDDVNYNTNKSEGNEIKSEVSISLSEHCCSSKETITIEGQQTDHLQYENIKLNEGTQVYSNDNAHTPNENQCMEDTLCDERINSESSCINDMSVAISLENLLSQSEASLSVIQLKDTPSEYKTNETVKSIPLSLVLGTGNRTKVHSEETERSSQNTIKKHFSGSEESIANEYQQTVSLQKETLYNKIIKTQDDTLECSNENAIKHNEEKYDNFCDERIKSKNRSEPDMFISISPDDVPGNSEASAPFNHLKDTPIEYTTNETANSKTLSVLLETVNSIKALSGTPGTQSEYTINEHCSEGKETIKIEDKQIVFSETNHLQDKNVNTHEETKEYSNENALIHNEDQENIKNAVCDESIESKKSSDHDMCITISPETLSCKSEKSVPFSQSKDTAIEYTTNEICESKTSSVLPETDNIIKALSDESEITTSNNVEKIENHQQSESLQPPKNRFKKSKAPLPPNHNITNKCKDIESVTSSNNDIESENLNDRKENLSGKSSLDLSKYIKFPEAGYNPFEEENSEVIYRSPGYPTISSNTLEDKDRQPIKERHNPFQNPTTRVMTHSPRDGITRIRRYQTEDTPDEGQLSPREENLDTTSHKCPHCTIHSWLPHSPGCSNKKK